MAAGLGYLDANGVWIYGESDTEALASDMLNIGQSSTSAAIAADRLRLDDIDTIFATSVGVACALRKSANQNLTTSATALSWDVEISDPAGMHNNVTNNTRLTAPVAGLYNVVASLYNGNTSGMGTTYARLNGTTDIPGSLDRRTADATAALPLKCSFTVALGAGDYVEIMVFHATAAGTIAGGTTTGAATVSMVRVGA